MIAFPIAPTDRVDSWIEVASQPSDSYTSSSSPEDAVITSGLHVQKKRKQHHSRRRRNSTSTAIPAANKAVESSSSEGEDDDAVDYDEDLDGIDLNGIGSMGSSITDPSLSEGEEGSSSEDDEDEDPGEIQPISAGSLRYPAQNYRAFSRDPPQPDHDAALRASLSTLLSCAAGVGSAAKPRTVGDRLAVVQEYARPAAIQTLSLVTDSEREAILAAPQPPPPAAAPAGHRRPAPVPSTHPHHLHLQHQQHHQQHHQQIPPQQHRPASPRRVKDDAKHKARTGRSRRASKANAAVVPAGAAAAASNMTYLTLAVSAGAVIIVSAISFSAGYALGKEAGRSEMLELGSSGGEIVKRAASGTVGKVGGRIVMSTGVGSGLRSITVS
ncbi:hypothetical protein DRE_04508 [Drechslerella stenobrocha 248]|uniref:Uncharacterized protein n=1 Tax=Drechslerella stenobrocha 248 TaxID=1043628 RepID=W7I1D5_9PEZI|nr:hypothetical protein DRE_04508 [Drechslerella stenobrocha 248]